MQLASRLLAFLLGGLLLSILASCERAEPRRKEQTDIVAGPGEVSFAEKYGLDISLPMPREEVVKTLDRLGLRLVLLGQRGSNGLHPKPYWSKSVDTSTLQKVFLVEGVFDSESRIRERYCFFVNDDDQVVYIENAFSYPDL